MNAVTVAAFVHRPLSTSTPSHYSYMVPQNVKSSSVLFWHSTGSGPGSDHRYYTPASQVAHPVSSSHDANLASSALKQFSTGRIWMPVARFCREQQSIYSHFLSC